jgi:hypothetical protein
MRRALLVLSSIVIGMVFASGVALAALPAEKPDSTHMVNGPVFSMALVDGNLWLGGDFNQVKTRKGTVVAKVSNVAVFSARTGRYKPRIAPKLGAGSPDSRVNEIKVYDDNGTKSVIIGGHFAGPSSTDKNLVAANASNGDVLRWYDSLPVQSILAAPDLGRVYAGGQSLQAFEFASARKLWARAPVTVDQSRHEGGNLLPGYRDLVRDGSTIWAACACDEVGSNPARALVKLNVEGAHDASWVAQTEENSFGISLTQVDGDLYLGAGGSDFVAAYPKASDGAHRWRRDASGQVQAVEIMDGRLIVGGHFLEAADQAADDCGFQSSNNKSTLDTKDECRSRKGLAAYSLDGDLHRRWNPKLAGDYNLAWALLPQGKKLHVGGDFLTAGGERQTNYARFS